jgi:hypothetical protein
LLYRFDMDQAVSPGAFVTTITDVVGYGPFLGIAAVGFGLACGGKAVLRPHKFETDMAVIITITHDENPVAPIWPCFVIMAGNQMG